MKAMSSSVAKAVVDMRVVVDEDVDVDMAARE
jgi:hypothetical protein